MGTVLLLFKTVNMPANIAFQHVPKDPIKTQSLTSLSILNTTVLHLTGSDITCNIFIVKRDSLKDKTILMP